MTTKEIAEKLGISPTTVRKWADVFGEFLSADATPGYRGVRDFTDDDLRLLSAVAFYRKQERLSFEEILEKLRRGEYPTESGPETQPPATEQPHPAPPAQNLEPLWDELHRLADAHQALHGSLTARLDDLARRLEALGPLPERVEDLTQHLVTLDDSLRRLDEAHSVLAIQEQVERFTTELHRRLEGLQALSECLDELREASVTRGRVEQLVQEVQGHLEVLQALQEHLADIDETLATREQIGQLEMGLRQRLEALQTLPKRLDDLREVLVTREQVEQLGVELQRHQEMLQVLQEHLAGIDETLATREQIEQLGERLQQGLEVLQALPERLDETREALVTREQAEQLGEALQQQADQIRTLQELPDQMSVFRAEIAELRREFREHDRRLRARRGVTEAVAHAVQVLSWAILLVAALGALYYLDLRIWLTVLLAVLITGGVWLASRALT